MCSDFLTLSWGQEGMALETVNRAQAFRARGRILKKGLAGRRTKIEIFLVREMVFEITGNDQLSAFEKTDWILFHTN